ncbi:MAG: hypothetical protein MI747_20130 [Desulfobacterales bacterium]|nr:hypothetical protein [Desulfobacterales bacterium]
MTQSLSVNWYDLDQGLLEQVQEDEQPRFHIYPYPDRAVVAGRGSCLETEIHLDRCRRDGIPVLRRRGGGCAVYLDQGNLIVSAVFPAPGIGNIQTLFSRCTQWLISGLKKLGMAHLYSDGISDLVLDDLKVGGSCFYRSKGVGYFSASLLYAPDIQSMERYLKMPPRSPDYRKHRVHSAFVAPLYPHLEMGSLDGFIRSLTPALEAELEHLSHH